MKTFDAVVDEHGKVMLTEQVVLPCPRRASVTILEEEPSAPTLEPSLPSKAQDLETGGLRVASVARPGKLFAGRQSLLALFSRTRAPRESRLEIAMTIGHRIENASGCVVVAAVMHLAALAAPIRKILTHLGEPLEPSPLGTRRPTGASWCRSMTTVTSFKRRINEPPAIDIHRL